MADNYKTIVVGSDGSKSSLLAVELSLIHI